MTEYDHYEFTKKEWITEIFRALCLTSGTGWLFFGKIWGMILLLPASYLLIRNRKREKGTEKKAELRRDFKEFATSFAGSVQAGYTIEQSISIGLEDMKTLYPGEDRALIRELEWMNRQMELQIPGDVLFADLASRSGLEEIRSFSVVLGIGKRQGGNLVQITRGAVEHINKKLQVQMEVEETIAGRKMEKNIMLLMPFFMLLYLRLTNASYMEVLFTTAMGHVLLAVCLLCLWLSAVWARKITDISL